MYVCVYIYIYIYTHSTIKQTTCRVLDKMVPSIHVLSGLAVDFYYLEYMYLYIIFNTCT